MADDGRYLGKRDTPMSREGALETREDRMAVVQLSPPELEAMLDRAAEKGAQAALEKLGLHDDHAPKDINELRDILSAWRETRKAIWSQVVKIGTTAVLALIATAVWLHAGETLKK